MPAVPYYGTSKRITGRAKTAVKEKTFVKIAGNRDGGNISIETATAGEYAFGIADVTAAAGATTGILRGLIVPVTASANIAAGAEVQVAANGQAVTKTTGVAVGRAVTAATTGNDAEIALY